MQAKSSQSAAKPEPSSGQRHSIATVRWQDVDTIMPHRSNPRPYSLFAITEHYGPGKLITPRPSPTSDTSTSPTSSSDELVSGFDVDSRETEDDKDGTEEDGSTTCLTVDKESWGLGLYLRLENAGSVARDHLALERTFLSYIRTSLALTSAGVALAQIMSIPAISDDDEDPVWGHHSPHYDHPKAVFGRRLGGMAIGLGMALLLIGLLRFFTIQWMLVHGRFPLSQHNIAGIASVFSMMLIAALTFIIIHH